MKTTTKPTKVFWVIAIIALLWNLMGVFQFLASTVMLDSFADQVPERELTLINALPSWYSTVFAVAVFAGLLGSILLLIRKKLAVPFLLISLLAVLVQMGYWLFATEAIPSLGIQAAIMPMLVIAVSIFLYFFSKGAAQKGWIN